jgi:hypothetical protein
MLINLINLTPHPIRVYSPDSPDRVDPASHDPIRVVEPSTDHKPARIREIQRDAAWDEPIVIHGVPVDYVEYTSLIEPLPEPDGQTWYVVPLIVALSQGAARTDLLVPYHEVRNLDGTIIGCRGFARPV